jgi:hypothetical protein
MESITIELRYDNSDATHKEILREAAQNAAQMLMTQAALIAGRRKPQIMITVSDAIAGASHISLFPEGVAK